MRAAVLIALTMLAASPSAAQAPPPAVKLPLSDEQKEAVNQGVRVSLRDPGSAQFSAYFAGKDAKGQTWVCGLVNAKNAHGGYTGDKPFLGLLSELPAGGKLAKPVPLFVVIELGGSERASVAALKMCREKGLTSK